MPKNQLTEREMLLDSIMTEEHISSAYNSGVIESVNQEVIQTLQHILNEEQNHAKLFMEIMHNQGWYEVQGAHINQEAKDQINRQMAFQLENRLNELE